MQQSDSRPEAGASPPPHVSLATIYWIFFQIGGLSFGGGLTAWLYREIVERRKLLQPADFMGGLTLAQVLPGINMANLSIYCGQRLRGVAGSVAAFFGLMSVPFFAVIGFATIYSWLVAVPYMQAVLDGVATAAVGLLMSMGVKSVRASQMRTAQFVIMGLVVLTIGVLRWPMVPVILVLTPISIALVWPWDKSDRTRDGADA